MGRLATKMLSLWNRLLGSFKEFPLEVALGIVYFLIFCFSVGAKNENMYCAVWFFPHYVLLFSAHQLLEGKESSRIILPLIWLLWVPALLLKDNYSGWQAGMSYVIAVALLVFGKGSRPDKAMAEDSVDTAIGIAGGFILGFLLMGIIMAILSSVGALFDVNIPEALFEDSLGFVAFNVIPLLCCIFVTGEGIGQKLKSSIVKSGVDYILSPAIILYTIILYAYMIRIIFRWELPDGGVAYMVGVYMVIALGAAFLRKVLEKPHFTPFFKYLPYIIIAPLCLLWIGTIRRVGEYGITEARFYLLMMAVLLTAFTVMLFLGKDSFRKMILMLVAVTAFFTFVPPFRAKDFAFRSQRAILRDAAEVLADSGKIPLRSTFSSDTESLSLWDKASGAYVYLSKNEGRRFSSSDPLYSVFFEPVYGEEPDDDYKVRSWNLEDSNYPVDIGEYTILLSPKMYLFTPRKNGCTFHLPGDKNMVTPILECDFKERIDSLKEEGREEEIIPHLVYTNEKYMLVLDEVRLGSYPFYEDVSLYMKP